MKEVLNYLIDLSHNNNREWFHAHKNRYEASKEKVMFVTEVFINEIRKFDSDIPAMDPGDCLFRIFRDVRFSADKSPYKTHFGSFIAKGGRKSTRAGYYFHIQPGESFLGGGVYMPDPDHLKAVRTAIYDQPEIYLSIVNNPGFKKYYSVMEGEKLKTAPKGFPAGFEFIDLIKPKSYAFSAVLTEGMVTGESFLATGVDAFRELYKLNRFLNDALDQYL